MVIRPVDRGTAQIGGRRVGYRRYGAAPGPGVATVLYCHGGLSCGADAALGHDAARQRGVSIVAVDRPGVADSDPLPARTTGSFAADGAAVLDHLGIASTVGAVGWSLGGQYALACGALMADRVPAVAVVAGVPPLSWDGVRGALSPTDRLLLRSVQRPIPVAVSTWVFALVGRQARRASAARGEGPSHLGRSQRRMWGPADAAVLGQPVGAVIDAAVAEATRSVDAMREEYLAWQRDWGVDLSAITAPVTVWHGDEDRWVPTALSERLAGAVHGARLVACPGEGHLLLASHWGDVVDRLLA